MSNSLKQLKAGKFSCPESIEIADYIQSVLASKPPTEEQEVLVDYAASVPFYLESIWRAAAEQGEEKLVQPILENIRYYFLDADDLIPDHHGAIGLLDDAYMVYCFINQLNTHIAEKTSTPLVDINLDYQVQLMAGKLGEDIAQQIETHVKSTIEGTILTGQLKTAGKYLFGGLALGFLINTLMNSGEQSNEDKWLELANNSIDHGW